MTISHYDALTLANAFIDAGEIEDALAALTPHLEDHPEDDAARRLRAAVFARLPGLAGKAHDDYRALRTLTRDDRIADAMLSIGQGDITGGTRILGVLLEQQPEDDSLLERLVHVLIAHPAHASPDASVVRLLDARLAQNPHHWRWWGWRGDLATAIGEDDGAITAYGYGLRALEKILAPIEGAPNPILVNQKAQFHLKRADASYRRAQYGEADADLVDAERLLPTDGMIPFKRALIAYQASRVAGADDWQNALRRALPPCRDALDHASPAIRALMRDALRADPIYRPLVEALLA